MTIKRQVAAAITLIFTMSLFAGCGKAENVVMDTTVPVNVTEAKEGSLETEGTYIASIENTEQVSVISQVSNNVTAVNVKVGDTVTAGDVLCKVDDSAAQIDYASAQIGVSSAKASLASSQASYESTVQQGFTQLGSSHTLSALQGQLDIESQELTVKNLEDKVSAAKDAVDAAKRTAEAVSNEAGTDSSSYASSNASYISAKNNLTEMENQLEIAKQSLSTKQQIADYKNGQVYLDEIEAVKDNIDIAAANMNTAQVGVSSANNKLSAASYALSLYTISAPMDGVVEAVNVETNNFVSSGNVCFVISNPNSRMAVFHVPDTVASQLKEGQAVSVTSNGNEYAGQISEVGVAVDSTGLFQIKANVYGADDLANGVNVKIKTVISKSNDAIVVPTDSVYFKENQGYVYVVEDGVAVQRRVIIGIYGEETTTVTSGLKVGEQVISSWSGSLKNGTEVSIIDGTEEESVDEDVEEVKEEAN